LINERAMPKPNCTEEIDVGRMDFGRLGRRVVQGCFDGGSMTSDGGVMLLGQVDRTLGLMDAAARCIAVGPLGETWRRRGGGVAAAAVASPAPPHARMACTPLPQPICRRSAHG
jgi:hypothetical protein